MNANEIVKALRHCIKCEREKCDATCTENKVDFDCQTLADLIASQQAEIDRLTALNKEALELLGLAENDVKSICKFCTHQLASERCTKCTSDHWQWLHNHCYETLKKKMEVTP